MKTLLVIASALVAFATSAPAADFYKAPDFNVVPSSVRWNQLYIGGNIGWTTGAAATFEETDYSSRQKFGNSWSAGIVAGMTRSIGRTGVVVGIEADFQKLGIKRVDDYTFLNDYYQETSRTTARAEWLATARGLVGYNLGQYLPYVSGGLAALRFTSANSGTYAYNDGWYKDSGSWSSSSGQYGVGWTVVAGLRYQATRNVAVDVSHQYVTVDVNDYQSGQYKNNSSFSFSQTKLTALFTF